MTSVFHVAKTGSDIDDGSQASPFLTINRAAAVAQPGDTIVVHAGEYREWVKPQRGGLSDRRRITYQAAAGEHVVVKGSERVTGWTPVSEKVWSVSVPNSMFGSFNPYAEEINGDWIVYPAEGARRKPLAAVSLKGMSFYEAVSRADVSEPPLRTEVLHDWTRAPEPVRNPEQTRYLWYAEGGPDERTIGANFR